MSILCAQIEAVLRRTKKNISSKSYGDITMDSEQHKAFFNGEEILLTPREFALLLYMAEHINVVLKREQILNAVWGYQYEGGERTVDTVVKHVRAKIADTKWEIQSLYGVGYRFEVRDEINT